MSKSNEENPDWALKEYDPDTTYPPNVEVEIRRLQVLKSYHMLDSEPDISYQRLVELATEMFHVKYAIINLIDLGRYYLLAQSGFPQDNIIKEGPRSTSICAHAIQSKVPLIHVPDCRLHKIFQKYGAVKDGVFRFYAAVPLVSPDGYRIGTFALMDLEERHLTPTQQESLKQLADTTMDFANMKRSTLQSGANSTGFSYSLDVQRSLSFLIQQISKMKEDTELQTIISEEQKHILKTVEDSANFLESALAPRPKRKAPPPPTTTTPKRRDSIAAKIGEASDVDIQKFVRSIEFVMDSFPRNVNLTIFTDPSLPERIYFNDLKVFRSTIALLTSACERTEEGFIHLRIHVKTQKQQRNLFFECEDTGPDVDLAQYHNLFMPPSDLEESLQPQECIKIDEGTGQVRTEARACAPQHPVANGFAVHAVAEYIGSMGGEYGFKPRIVTSNDPGFPTTGSIFWFSIPLRQTPHPDFITSQAVSSEQRSLPRRDLETHKFENTVLLGRPRAPPPRNAQPSWLSS